MVMTAIPTVALGSRTFLGAFTLAHRRLALFGARVMPVSLGPQMRELLADEASRHALSGRCCS
jgi:hypothetical protein